MWGLDRSIGQCHHCFSAPAVDRRRVQSSAAAPLQPLQLAPTDVTATSLDALPRPVLTVEPPQRRGHHPSPNHTHTQSATARGDPLQQSRDTQRSFIVEEAASPGCTARDPGSNSAAGDAEARRPASSSTAPAGPGSSFLSSNALGPLGPTPLSANSSRWGLARPNDATANDLAASATANRSTVSTSYFLDVEPLILAMVGNRLPGVDTPGPCPLSAQLSSITRAPTVDAARSSPGEAASASIAAGADDDDDDYLDTDVAAELTAAAAAAVASAAMAALFGFQQTPVRSPEAGPGPSRAGSSNSSSSSSAGAGASGDTSWLLPPPGGADASMLYDSPQALLRALDLMPDGFPPAALTGGAAGMTTPTLGRAFGSATSGPQPAAAGPGLVPAGAAVPAAATAAISSPSLLPPSQQQQLPGFNEGRRDQSQIQGGSSSGVFDGLLAALAPASPLTPGHHHPQPSLPQQRLQLRQRRRPGAGSETDGLMTYLLAEPAAAAVAAPGTVVQAPLPRLEGPGMALVTARGRTAAALVFAAAGASLPSWAQRPLTAGGAVVVPEQSGSRLDPALDWALGVLSPAVSPAPPSHWDLRMANRTVAAHLGHRWEAWDMTRGSLASSRWHRSGGDAAAAAGSAEPVTAVRRESVGTGAGDKVAAAAHETDPWVTATARVRARGPPVGMTSAGGGLLSLASASGSGSFSGSGSSMGWSMDGGAGFGGAAAGRAAVAGGGGGGGPLLPWPLLLPLLGAIGERISPATAGHLLRALAVQVGAGWRSRLAPRQQTHLAATLRALLGAVLRSPEAVSPQVAAGVLAVLSQMRVRSVPVVAALTERTLAALEVAPEAPAPPPGPAAHQHPAAAATTPVEAGAGAAATATAAAATVPLGGADAAAAAAGRLRLVLWSLSSLGRLGCGLAQQLPNKAVGRLLRIALRDVSAWTPPATAGLLVWSARLRHRPTAAFLRALESRLLGGAARTRTRTRTRTHRRPSRARLALHPLKRGVRPALQEQHQQQQEPKRASGPAAAGTSTPAGPRRWRVGRRQRPGAARLSAAAGRRRQSGAAGGVLREGKGEVISGGGGGGGLISRMGGYYLAATLEALVELYGDNAAVQPPSPGGPSAAAGHAHDSGDGAAWGSDVTAAGRAAAAAAAAAVATANRRGTAAAVARSSSAATNPVPSAAAAVAVKAADVGRRRGGGVGTGGGSGTRNMTTQECLLGSAEGSAPEVRAASHGRREGPSPGLMIQLATCTLRRVGQLQYDQLCRLPLLLRRLGFDAAAAGPRLPQGYYDRTRQLLRRCDAVDLMLLLRGLAAAAEAEAGSSETGVGAAVVAAAGSAGPKTAASATSAAWSGAAVPGSGSRRRTRPGMAAGRAATRGGVGVGPPPGVDRAAAVCLEAELADEAVRRYLALLPSGSDHLRHTAVIIESVAVLWPRHHHHLLAAREEAATSLAPPRPLGGPPLGGTAAPSGASSALSASSSSSSRQHQRQSRDAAAGTARSDAPSDHEADLLSRQLADLVSERESLLEQLEEHVVRCLARGGSAWAAGGGGRSDGGGGGARGAARWDPRRGGADMQAAAKCAKLAVKLLGAYCGLQRRPPPRLQAALESALVAGLVTLGASSWLRVRRAYQRLRLTPGRDLSVALVTFG